ncbi:MAG: hypothetical protein GF313_16290 [Caldithrix sp.]|nr:hypothetical protein [Caldithrix sp.]
MFRLKNFMVTVVIVVLIHYWPLPAQDTSQSLQMLQEGRRLFHQAVFDESKIDSAKIIFQKLSKEFPHYEGRATAYLGALTALEGKHAFWVYTKYKKVVKGLKIMDRGVKIDSTDLESRFIRGTTTYYLPGLFNRGQSTEADFSFIRQQLPAQYKAYHPKMIINVINFFLEKQELNRDERKQLENLKHKLADS